MRPLSPSFLISVLSFFDTVLPSEMVPCPSVNAIEAMECCDKNEPTGVVESPDNQTEEEFFHNFNCVDNKTLKKQDNNQESTIHVPVERLIETDEEAWHYAQELNRGLDSLNNRLDKVLRDGSAAEFSKMHDIPTSLSSKIPIVGFEMEVGASSTDFFSFLTGKEGCTFLDPDADPEDFGKPILGPFPLREDDHMSHSQIEYSSINYLHRDFVVLNLRDFEKGRFMTASAQFPGIPGSSGINGGERLQRSKMGRLRIPIIGFYQVQPVDHERCALRVFQWIDLGGAFPAYISSFGNRKCLVKLQKKIKERFPVPSSSGSSASQRLNL